MSLKLVNLTSLSVVEEIENILYNYPEYPYQAAFTISYWKQRLIAYVLSSVPNRYAVIEPGQNMSCKSYLSQFPTEQQLALENSIHAGIIDLLRNNPRWQDQQFAIQELSINVLDLEILSRGYPNSIPFILPDGKIFFSLKKQELDYNFVTYGPVPIHDNQEIIPKENLSEELLQEPNKILADKVRELERNYGEMSIFNDLNDHLLRANNKIAVYHALNKIIPLLLPETKGGIFKLNFLNDFVESMATWGKFSENELSLVNLDFWAFRQGYLDQTLKDKSSLFASYIHRQPNAGDSQCISLICDDNTLEAFYITNENPKPLSIKQQKLIHSAVKKTALGLSKLMLQDNLQKQSFRDPLTNLFNHRYFEERLPKEIAQANLTQSSFSIVKIDVDHFNTINDTFGPKVGDLALQALARFLQKHVHDTDLVCRYGTQEFIIIFPDISLKDTRDRVEEIRQKVKNITIFDDNSSAPIMTISVGVASFPKHGTTYEKLILSVDRHLSLAKQQAISSPPFPPHQFE